MSAGDQRQIEGEVTLCSKEGGGIPGREQLQETKTLITVTFNVLLENIARISEIVHKPNILHIPRPASPSC